MEEGKLELDDPVAKYIPAAGRMKFQGKSQSRQMTVRDLLRHTAGFSNNVTVDSAFRKAGLPPLHESIHIESCHPDRTVLKLLTDGVPHLLPRIRERMKARQLGKKEFGRMARTEFPVSITRPTRFPPMIQELLDSTRDEVATF